VMAQTRKSCDALRAQAEARLADAAESIVRRVVKTNVHC
jgi:V/A-type H+-transporting ATPase subunit G/H